VAELPIRGEGLVREETIEMYFSTAHFRPIIHGYTAYPPLLARLLRRFAARFPSEASLEALRRVGVDTIIVHHGRPLGLDLRQRIAATPGRDDPDERFERLLRQAGLDLYARLPGAVSARRLALEARFEGEEARLFQSTADEVYRLLPLRTRVAAAPFPHGRRVRGEDWRWRAKLGRPELAADGNLETAWTVAAPLRGDEFLEVRFPDALTVSGLVLTLTRDSRFPTRFRVAGRDRKGDWSEIARFDDAHALQLLESLQRDPRVATLGFVLGERELTGIRLLVAEEGTSFDGWWLPEVEVLAPR
jgi:hypothetical protein